MRGAGELYRKGGSYPHGAGHQELAPVAVDDVVGNAESQAGSLPHILGGEERFKDPVQNIVRDTPPSCRSQHGS